jgi:hypothetical protein
MGEEGGEISRIDFSIVLRKDRKITMVTREYMMPAWFRHCSMKPAHTQGQKNL